MDTERVMSPNPITCTEADTLAFASRLMLAHDIGFLPVVGGSGAVCGVITDRDIVCRGIALGKDPVTARVAECMTSPAVHATMWSDLSDCEERMTVHQVRRVVIIDDMGGCRGVVSQKDLAACETTAAIGEVSMKVLQPK